MTNEMKRKRRFASAGALVAVMLTGPSMMASAGSQPVMTGATVFLPDLPIIKAQANEEGYSNESDGGGVDFAARARLRNPGQVTNAIQEANDFCRSLPASEYAIDCLAYEYWEIQKRLPDYGEMADVKKILRDTADKLNRLAAANKSPVKPEARISQAGPSPKKTSRNIIPVDRRKLPALSREAAKIINDGATLLIRATGDSDRKRQQYQKIARSMRTGAIMLRSL